jgi:hypothetical protein
VRPPDGGPDRLGFRRRDAIDYWNGEMSTAQRPVVHASTVEVMAEAGAPPGFHTRYRQLGPLLGGEMLGATVYELDPGERNGPYLADAVDYRDGESAA